jgi:hypothetical protein
MDEQELAGDASISPIDSELTQRVAEETGIEPAKIQHVIEIVKARYSGPIPPTSEIVQLNAIEPGLGTRLVQDHLNQREHDRLCDLQTLGLAQLESERKDGWLRYAGRGQSFGVTSLFAFLLAALVALWLGHPVVATAFVSPAIAGAISKFLLRSERDSDASGEDD